MFTGIITQCGTVVKIQTIQQASKLRLSAQFTDLQMGESIAVNGVCLTVANIIEGRDYTELDFDISPETSRLTTLCFLREGGKVNLERALRLSDRLGGHFVSGHIDQVCSLAILENQAEFTRMEFMGISKTALHNIIKKGSIAVNGVSLTVNNIFINNANNNYSFEVMLIPQTLEKTCFSELKIGDKVNIEFDMIIKIVNNKL